MVVCWSTYVNLRAMTEHSDTGCEYMETKSTQKTLSTLAMGMIMMIAMPVPPAAAQGNDPVDCEDIMDQIQDVLERLDPDEIGTDPSLNELLDQFKAECGPCDDPVTSQVCNAIDPQTDPTINIHSRFSFGSCNGVKEHITEDETSIGVGGGGVSAGPLKAVFVFAGVTFTSESKGWQWSFDCELTVSYFYAVGDGSFDREVAIRGTSQGDTRTEASCVYLEGGCETPSILEGTWAVSVSSDGTTSGYPQKASAEIAAYGINKPADQESICVIHPPCFQNPSLGAIIDGRSVTHSPAYSELSEISWTEAGLGIGELVGDVQELVDGLTG